MKEFIWKWAFWGSVLFFGILSVSLLISYTLYTTAPENTYTPVFASGFGFVFGFFGLGFITLYTFDKLETSPLIYKETENEILNRVIKEAPFFFFALTFFFSMVVYMGIFLLVLSYIRNSCI